MASTHYVNTTGDFSGRIDHTDLVIDVHPPGGAPFRAEAKITYSDFAEMHYFIPPRAGDTLRVSFERKSGKITVRMDPAHDRRLAEQARQDQMERLLHAAPGSGVTRLLSG